MDWSKYATPSFTLKHLPDPFKTNGIVELKVGELRPVIKKADLPLDIEHDPIRTQIEGIQLNRAHSLINGIKKTNKTKVKRLFSKIAQWARDMAPYV